MHPYVHIKKIIKKIEIMLLKRSFLTRKPFNLMKIITTHLMTWKIQIHVLIVIIKYLWLLKISKLINHMALK